MEPSVTGPTPSYTDIRLTADRAIAGLANSDDPTICAHCFLNLTLSLVYNQSHLQRLRAERHELFDSCMAVVFTWSARHNDEELLPTLIRNVSRCPNPAHRTDRAQAATTTQAIYTPAYSIVTMALGKGANAPSERANSNKNFSDRAGRWPSKVAQLFPLGEQATVAALLVAAERDTRTSGPISLLGQLLAIARSIVWPVLISEPHRRRLLLIIIVSLTPPTGPDSRPWLGDDGILALVTSLLGKIRVGPDSRINDMEQLIGDDAEILYQAVTAALDMVPDSSEVIPELALWCHTIYHAVPRGTLPESRRAVHWLKATLQPQQQSLELATDTELELALALEVAVSRLMRLRACVFCGISSVRMDDGKALSLCAGCKLVLYCSKSCQRQHWHGKGGRSAHKAVCPILRRIDGINQRTTDWDELVATIKKVVPTLTAEEVGILGDWLFDMRHMLGEDALIRSNEISSTDGRGNSGGHSHAE